MVISWNRCGDVCTAWRLPGRPIRAWHRGLPDGTPRSLALVPGDAPSTHHRRAVRCRRGDGDVCTAWRLPGRPIRAWHRGLPDGTPRSLAHVSPPARMNRIGGSSNAAGEPARRRASGRDGCVHGFAPAVCDRPGTGRFAPTHAMIAPSTHHRRAVRCRRGDGDVHLFQLIHFRSSPRPHLRSA